MTNKFQLALTVLDRALTTKRPHLNPSTIKFCAWLMKLLPHQAFTDGCGNIHVDTRGKKNVSRSLFVAHVDTVHRVGGKNKVIKTDKRWSANGAPLGADDGAGVAILAHMISHGVPGYYIFTQGEEVGGIGAKWLADHMPGLLKQFDRAIAFDRRATYSVITHQGMGRCASEKFGDALSDAFNKRGMLFATDDGGVYTDTAEFVDFIPECTNVSAGYDMEHTERETLDMDHFMDLCKTVIKIDWEALPVVRDPAAVEKFSMSSWYGKYGALAKVTKTKSKATKGTPVSRDFDIAEYPSQYGFNDFQDNPILDATTANYDPVLMEAIDSAFDGNPRQLISIMAKAVDSKNPRVVEKMINPRLFTEAFLCQLYDDAFLCEADTLLNNAFDEVGVLV